MRRSTVFSRSRSAIAALVLIATLAACATTPQPEPPGYADLLALGQAAEAGQPAAALDAYTRAAQVDPSRKEPWLRIAMLHRDAGRPVQALAAAEETLQRDPSDVVANEVFIGSGLQIARQTMQRLRPAASRPMPRNTAKRGSSSR